MGNFSIDLNEKFDSLSNAPIVEAVIQFNAPPSQPFDQAKLKDLLETRFAGYKTHGQMQVEAGFESSDDGNLAMHHKTHWDGFRLHSEDGKYICQWKRSALVFSRLQPYQSWSGLLSAVMPFWIAYQEVGRPSIIEGIGVRYISQIPLRDNEKPTRYVQKIHPPLIGLG